MNLSFRTITWIIASMVTAGYAFQKEPLLPAFGRDTVLVWNILNHGGKSNFVVRIAEFLPDRFVEWEDASSQGTIFMENRALTKGRTFINASLFQSGVDTRGKDATTLWLSEAMFFDLKARQKLKVKLDGVEEILTLVGEDVLDVEVNRSAVKLPVIKVADKRGSERWFLDYEDNPLMVRHMVREYDERLASITTDKPNTLRWIKGRKLTAPH